MPVRDAGVASGGRVTLALLLLWKREDEALSAKEGLSETAGASWLNAERANAAAIATGKKRVMSKRGSSDEIRTLRLRLASTDTICNGGVGPTPPRFRNA
ncbi:hypothetical protein [Caballeronia sp. LZ043]|uniref:hypothetical protein n=1 Tax=Caballeronia sp. LZ043 TaxID=3038569 RepID=UPI0028595AD8|nr:hypothetical protein [Caballeronia sp. LZ043]MDR5825375.1 hypothetical protein [Caballeronia sp. LZ043]